MGAWGVGIFDSDCNCDSFANFEIKPIQQILKTIQEYTKNDLKNTYLEIDEAGDIIIAALLAAGFKNQNNISKREQELTPYFLKKVLDIINSNQKEFNEATKGYVTEDGLDVFLGCKKALSLVISPYSESYELWGETDLFREWLGLLESLIGDL